MLLGWKNLRARYWPRLRLFQCTLVRAAGFIPVILVSAILTLAYITAVPATLIPLAKARPIFGTISLLIFHFIYANVIINYAVLVLADPGGVPHDWHADPDDVTEDQRRPQTTDFVHSHLMRERTYDGLLRYCNKCKCYKPDRTHHCSVCRRCITRMDHHCVFINNCVSFVNHKFFLAFVTYACIGCTFVTVYAFPTMSSVIFEPLPTSTSLANRHGSFSGPPMSTALESAAVIGWILCLTFAFALLFFVLFHSYLVTRGKTTIELYESSDPERVARIAEYNVGVARNWRLACGNVPACWPFPVRAHIEGDGVSWPRNETAEGDRDPLLELEEV